MLVIHADYERSEHAGAGGCFQIGDISIEGDTTESILDKVVVDQGKHYHSVDEVINELGVDVNKVDIRVERV